MTTHQKLLYLVVIITMIMLLATMLTTVHQTIYVRSAQKSVLQMRARAPWFSNHPEPAQSAHYKPIPPVESTREHNYTVESNEKSNHFWDNFLDVSYWSYSSVDGSEFDSSDGFEEYDVEDTLGESVTCPERRTDVLMEDGTRNIPPELYNMATQVFDSGPNKFIDNVKNPCWEDSQNGVKNINCLPSFFLAGFPKAGTTDLWAKIVSHPKIIRTTKEPHWWTRRRLGGSTLQRYTGKFYSRLSGMIANEEPDAGEFIVGDGSASTFWDNKKWQSYFNFNECKDQGPPYVIADVIHTVIPKSKIIVIMRNPTTRLYSGYIFFGGATRTNETFHRDVISSIEMFNECLKTASYRTCAYTVRGAPTRLVIGLYSVYVRDWLKAFPRDQIMFLRLEDWHSMCPEYLSEVYTFLGVESLPEDARSEICSQKLRNPTKKYHGSMMDETRQLLNDFYSKTKRELADILDDEKYLWS